MTATTTTATTGLTRTRTLRHRVAGILAGLGAALCVTLATAAPASASNGNIASPMASCNNGAASIRLEHNMDYEYVMVWKYDYALGWIGGNQWQRLTVSASTDLGPVMAGQAGWFAVYLQYADWNGASWDISGEWVPMNWANGTQSYWCR